MCVYAFFGMQSPRIGLILVLEGVVFHYIWFECLFETVTIYSEILFEHFLFKNGKLRIKKKKATLTFRYFGSVGKGQANIFFFRPKVQTFDSRCC